SVEHRTSLTWAGARRLDYTDVDAWSHVQPAPVGLLTGLLFDPTTVALDDELNSVDATPVAAEPTLVPLTLLPVLEPDPVAPVAPRPATAHPATPSISGAALTTPPAARSGAPETVSLGTFVVDRETLRAGLLAAVPGFPREAAKGVAQPYGHPFVEGVHLFRVRTRDGLQVNVIAYTPGFD
ncbi:hypothetical protein U6M47_12960, partial [Cutibacterium acnes]